MHNSLLFICGCCFLIIITTLAIVYETKRIILLNNNYWDDSLEANSNDNDDSIIMENDININNNNNNDNYHLNLRNLAHDLQTLATGYFLTTNDSLQQQQQQQQQHQLYTSNWYEAFYKIKHRKKREIIEYDNMGNRVYNVGVLMASHLDSPFDLERCGPAVDLALDVINKEFLSPHNITLRKVQASYPSCSGAKAPGLAGLLICTLRDG
ncbi:hypothetical protein DOY81_011234, partial [Sarcophaga bullata]